MSDLVERLRKTAKFAIHYEAADRIDALEAGLLKYGVHSQRNCDLFKSGDGSTTWIPKCTCGFEALKDNQEDEG